MRLSNKSVYELIVVIAAALTPCLVAQQRAISVSAPGAPSNKSAAVAGPKTALTAPALVSPADGATGISLTPTLTWSASAGATNYYVLLGESYRGQAPPWGLSLVGATEETSFTPPALTGYATYYWRVEVADSSGVVSSSPTWKFSTKPGPPPFRPFLNSITNSASYERADVGDKGIAQGSIFVLFGWYLGPSDLQQAAAFPLPTNLGLTSISVTVAGKTVDVPILYTFSEQVAALLPSSVPVGDGTLRLYNGYPSAYAELPIRVVQAAPGIYAVSGNGLGAGSITTAAYQLKDYAHPAWTNDTLVLWGTGLGAVEGDDAAGPLPGNRFSDVEVYVGGVRAPVDYAGRSGCCAGLDQIVFRVPDSPQGCFVPVAMRYGGNTSNFVTIPIGEPGQQCRETVGIPPATLAKAAAGEDVTVGAIAMGPIQILQSGGFSFYGTVAAQLSEALKVKVSENDVKAIARAGVSQRKAVVRSVLKKYQPLLAGRSISAKDVLRTVATLQDQGIAAGFLKLKGLSALTSMFGGMLPPPGTCTIVKNWSFESNQWGAASEGEDAGAQLVLTGPLGTYSIQSQSTGEYQAAFGPASTLGRFPTGEYTVTGPGGKDVGAFSASLQSTGLMWTNMQGIVVVDRTKPLRITWAGMPDSGYVMFGGTSKSSGSGLGFTCVAPADAGELTVPTYILSAMPKTLTDKGVLVLAAHPLQNVFSAHGIDVGFFVDLGSESKEVDFQ